MNPTDAAEREALRRDMKSRRRRLPPGLRAAAAAAVSARLAASGVLRPGQRVGVYLPMAGELDTRPAIDLARRLGCIVHAPVIDSFSRRSMRFAELAGPGGPRRNRWGIEEPARGRTLNGRWLHVVLVPCVAFDERGGRLGMGAGFYDRHFGFLRERRAWRRPLLIGLAYEFQRVASLPQAPWDVRLNAVLTEQACHGTPFRGMEREA